MDQLICASFSHICYWYEVGMLKAPYYDLVPLVWTTLPYVCNVRCSRPSALMWLCKHPHDRTLRSAYEGSMHYYIAVYNYKPILLYTQNVFCLAFVWCPCMAVYVSVQHNGGFLPGTILLTPMLLPSGNPFKYHEEALYQKLMTPPKRFDIFPPDCECSEGLDAFRSRF